MKVDVNTSVFYITQISCMKIVEEEPENVQYWKDMAKKVIQHKHVILLTLFDLSRAYFSDNPFVD